MPLFLPKGVLRFVAPHLTVVSTPPLYEAFQRMRGTMAHVAWVVSNAAVVHETTGVPGRSSSGR